MISQIKTYLVAALASLVSIMGIYVPWRLMAHWCNVSTTANLNALGDGDGNFSMLGAVFVWPLFMFVLPMVVVLILRASKISRFIQLIAVLGLFFLCYSLPAIDALIGIPSGGENGFTQWATNDSGFTTPFLSAIACPITYICGSIVGGVVGVRKEIEKTDPKPSNGEPSP